MTGQEALAELLDRIGASQDGVVFVGEQEVREWPRTVVTALKSVGLLAQAAPATSVVCPGCEQQCVMPVHRAPAGAFVVCDKRSNINRVSIEPDSFVRWQASGEAVAALLARLLRLRRRAATSVQSRRWEVGTFKGLKGSSHLVLMADGSLRLAVAGHTIDLGDVLSFRGKGIVIEVAVVTDRVDNPAASGGDVESARQRRTRLRKRLEVLKAQGDRRFLQTLAREEGISPTRVKQILGRSDT